MRLGRVAAVTASLALVGAFIGGVIGAVLLTARSLVLGDQSDLVVMKIGGAVFSALLGAVLAPATAWLFLRRVALGRAIAHTTIGTTAGAAIGMAVEAFVLRRPSAPLGVIGALLGFFAAAVRLRIITRNASVEPRATTHGA